MKTTDWDSYYEKPYKTAKYSRKFTESRLLKLLQECSKDNPVIVTEFGGANSCFYDAIMKKIEIKEYIIIDNNQTGLDKFNERLPRANNTKLLNRDIQDFHTDHLSDITYSIGLIEHFSFEGTRRAIESHFDNTKVGGFVIISFPTPTLLYRITRKVAEILRMWIFHDERPLQIKEVSDVAKMHGEIVYTKIVWPIFLTQAFIVVRKE